MKSINQYLTEKFKISSKNINHTKSFNSIAKEILYNFCGDDKPKEYDKILNEYKEWLKNNNICDIDDLDGIYYICKDNEILNEYKKEFKDKEYKFDNDVEDILDNLQIIASTFANKFIITNNFIGHYIYDYKKENIYVGYKLI